MTIYFLAGEASGDTHGAALMKAIRDMQADVQFVGRGGPKMAEVAGGGVRNWIHEAAVVGLWEVVRRYGFFREQFAAVLREIDETKPHAVLLIDYPGFNLRLARALRKRGVKARIIYYISPQVWAWNRGRIPQMAKSLDLMLCIFPFEAGLYNASGLRTMFVGHPIAESLGPRRTDGPREPDLVGLFPGSRLREVRLILPIMLETAATMLRSKPDLRFEIAAASDALAAEIKALIDQPAHFTITTGEAHSLMQRAFVGIVASGSATLEAAFFRLPFVLVYRVSWLTYLAARAVVKVKHLGMPNVLAGREIVPEFIQHRAKPLSIAAATLRLLHDEPARDAMFRAFAEVIAKLAETNASATAAKAILHEIDAR
ncbi:MAG: lipid-A-disaccharide synthase [Chthoniobacterales bacterium]